MHAEHARGSIEQSMRWISNIASPAGLMPNNLPRGSAQPRVFDAAKIPERAEFAKNEPTHCA